MTANELELIVIALRYRVGYEDSNPDVGFGPSLEGLLNSVLSQCGMTLSETELATVIGVYQIKGYRPPR